MDYIVVYDKKTEGNPITGIHSQRFGEEDLKVTDIHPDDDPKKCGLIIVPEEIVRNMIAVKYKADSKGNVVEEPVVQEITKDLATVKDTSLKTNIVAFGESVKKLVSVKNLTNKNVKAKLVDAEKGVLDMGSGSGLMTVTCMVPSGETQPVIESEKANWKWLKDKKGNITGMTLIKKPPK